MSYEVTEEDIEKTKILTKHMIRKWEFGLVNFDDVLGDGLEGLARAALNYDSTKGKEFWAYATPSVRGYILHGFRRRFGEKSQKLEIAKAESLSVTDSDEVKPWMQISVEENWNTLKRVMEKIENLDLSKPQKRIMHLMAAGYIQADIVKIVGTGDGNISRSVQLIRKRFTREELSQIIE